MNRNLIMCLAFLITAQATRAMEEERNEKIKIGTVSTYLSAHVVEAIIYAGAPLNGVRIYRYEHEQFVDNGEFGAFTEEEKWEISEEVYSKNYIYVSGAHPKLVLGIKDKAQVEELLDPAKSKPLEKKPSLRRTLSFWKNKKK